MLASCSASSKSAVQYRVKVLQVLPHDRTAYTQGLFFNGGKLYETTGQYGESMLREVDLATGRTIRETRLDSRYFGEGSCIFDGKLYVMTWQEHKVFVYDPATFKLLGQCANTHEGWGLTTDGRKLYASDGSSSIFEVDGDSFAVKKEIKVKLAGKPVNYLNELEWIDGKIWANVYTQDVIVIIDPASGKVTGVVDCTGLLPADLRTGTTDVLNGIAVDGATGDIYLTGKYWPRMYRIKLETIR